jgi:hypothetical protein
VCPISAHVRTVVSKSFSSIHIFFSFSCDRLGLPLLLVLICNCLTLFSPHCLLVTPGMAFLWPNNEENEYLETIRKVFHQVLSISNHLCATRSGSTALFVCSNPDRNHTGELRHSERKLYNAVGLVLLLRFVKLVYYESAFLSDRFAQSLETHCRSYAGTLNLPRSTSSTGSINCSGSIAFSFPQATSIYTQTGTSSVLPDPYLAPSPVFGSSYNYTSNSFAPLGGLSDTRAQLSPSTYVHEVFVMLQP